MGEANVRCLVVDDEPAILRLVAVVLRDLGCDTLTAPDAESALDLVQDAHPDIVITDVKLPRMDGLELARRIKSDDEAAETPVLLMSAFGEPRDHAGDGFLPKPFDIDGLVDFIAPYVNQAA
jgi:CheY-like chemotaxis protein